MDEISATNRKRWNDLASANVEWSDPASGSWAHFTQVAPPWFDSFWKLQK